LFALKPIISIYKTRQIYGISIDANFNLYCTNSIVASQITKISSNGTETQFGSAILIAHSNCIDVSNTSLYITNDGTNINQYSLSSGLQIGSSLSVPSYAIDIVVDASGNRYIANAVNNLYVVRSGTTTAINLITPSGATTYASSISGTTTAANFKGADVYGVTINSGKLYVVCQSGGYVISLLLSEIYASAFNPAQIKVYKFAGTGTSASITAPIPVGTLATSSTLNSPRDIQFNNGYAYILETGGNMIKKVNVTTNVITCFASSNSALSPTLTTSLFNGPTSFCIDNVNNIMYIANVWNNNILKITNV
jgi:hypothetical protein